MIKQIKKEDVIMLAFEGMKKGVLKVTMQEVNGSKIVKHQLIKPQHVEYFIKELKHNYSDSLESSKSYIKKYGKERSNKILHVEVLSDSTVIREAGYYGCDDNHMSDYNQKKLDIIKFTKKSNGLRDKIVEDGGKG